MIENTQFSQHISRQFNAELEDLRQQVLIMGGMVEEQLADALEALIELDGKKGLYSHIMLLDNLPSIAAGREIWGFPKFMAEVDYQRDEKNASASVRRNGVEILTMSMALNERGEAPPIHDHDHFLLKSMPNPCWRHCRTAP